MLETEKQIERVRKLLQMVENNGATKDEAQTAMIMAQELMAKYHLDMLQVEGGKEEEVLETIAKHAGKEVEYVLYPILQVIAKNFRCLVVGEWTYTKGHRDRRLRIIGLEMDTKVVGAVYNLAYQTFWLEFMEFSFENIQGKRTKGKVEDCKKAFAQGFAVGLKRIFLASTNKNSAVKALMVVTPKKVMDYMAGLNTKMSKGPILTNPAAYSNGCKAGKDFGESLGKGQVGHTQQIA